MKSIKEILTTAFGIATIIFVSIFSVFLSMNVCIEVAKLWK